MIDLHSHILPKMDDGSASIHQSIEMLQASREQGIKFILASPHFYIKKDTVEVFLERRRNSFKILNEELKKYNDLPKIFLGAEVKFFNNIGSFDQLNDLCIEGTKYMLLEMPFEQWSSRVLRDVENIVANKDVIPIIAHIERYIGFQKDSKPLEELVSMNLLIQMNAEFVNSVFTRNKAINFLKTDIVQIMGSDCHNTTVRKPNLGKAYEIIRKKCGDDMIDKINHYASKVLNIDNY